jgi:hypothetical protein
MKNTSLKLITATCVLPGALLLGALALAGCETEVHESVAYRQDQYGPVADDDYVYYPQYEMYYSNHRHQYGYRDGNSWVWRSSPSRVQTNVLVASPSVHLNFHDSPERHHAETVKTYPHNWRQNDKNRGKDDHRNDDHRDDHRDNDRQH